jgi:hypothetical protein
MPEVQIFYVVSYPRDRRTDNDHVDNQTLARTAWEALEQVTFSLARMPGVHQPEVVMVFTAEEYRQRYRNND